MAKGHILMSDFGRQSSLLKAAEGSSAGSANPEAFALLRKAALHILSFVLLKFFCYYEFLVCIVLSLFLRVRSSVPARHGYHVETTFSLEEQL